MQGQNRSEVLSCKTTHTAILPKKRLEAEPCLECERLKSRAYRMNTAGTAPSFDEL